MILRYVALLFVFLSFPVFASIAPNNGVVGFSAWKNQKIRSAFSNYETSQKTYTGSKGTVFERNNLYKAAASDYRVLGATRKLTIHDYFQMYLMSQFPENKDALQSALSSLSQQQVAELLVAYQKNLRGKTQKLYIQRNR